MYTIHLVGQPEGPVFLGRSTADKRRFMVQLAPELQHDECVWMGPSVATFGDAAHLNALALRALARYATRQGQWWQVSLAQAVRFVRPALAGSTRMQFPDFTQGLIRVREMLGVDAATLAAMLGVSSAKVSRMMAGKAPVTLRDYAALRSWCDDLGCLTAFRDLFPIDPLPDMPPARPGLTLVGK